MNTGTRPEFALISALFVLFLLFVVRVYAGHWAVALQIVQPSGSSSAGRPQPAAGASVRPAPLPAPVPAAPAPAASAPAARPTLAPTDEPPPRNTTDEHGVFYDEHGVAITGIIADPSGVHNVPPGRLVRIGGPVGKLYEVLPGGKLKPVPE